MEKKSGIVVGTENEQVMFFGFKGVMRRAFQRPLFLASNGKNRE